MSGCVPAFPLPAVLARRAAPAFKVWQREGALCSW